MNMKTAGIALLIAFMVSGCASTADPEWEEAYKGAAEERKAKNDELPKDHPDKMVCKNIVKTGSRVSTKVCAKNREWKATEEAAQDSTEKMQRRTQHGRDAG